MLSIKCAALLSAIVAESFLSGCVVSYLIGTAGQLFSALTSQEPFRNSMNATKYFNDPESDRVYNGDRRNDYKPLSLWDLRFVFGILGIGLGCATISFIVEVIVGRAHSRKRLYTPLPESTDLDR